MASKNNSSDDNLENKKNKKYDDKFDCYSYDDNKMYTMYLENKSEAPCEKKKAIEIAKNLLKNNVDISIIISSTGFSKKEIDALRHAERD